MEFRPTNCAICKAPTDSNLVYPSSLDEDTMSIQVFSARRTPDRRHYAWVQCKICGLMRSDPVATIDLSELYKDSTFDYSLEVTGLKSTYLKIMKKFIFSSKHSSILEVGGGNGFLLEALVDNGFTNVSGIEPSVEAVNLARSDIRPKMITGMCEPGIMAKDGFDVICMFHVLDHLEDPLRIIETCIDSLKPSGFFVVAVHNQKSWSAKLLGEKSPIVDVEHTYLYSKSTAKKLFSEAGLTSVSSGSYWNNYSLSYIIHLIPLPVNVKNGILQSRLGVILSKVRVILPLGNIWVAGQKKSSENEVSK